MEVRREKMLAACDDVAQLWKNHFIQHQKK